MTFINNKVDRLNWDITYARRKQLDRLTDHIERGESIGSFLYDHSEYSLDDIYARWMSVRETLTVNTKPKKKFWQRKK